MATETQSPKRTKLGSNAKTSGYRRAPHGGHQYDPEELYSNRQKNADLAAGKDEQNRSSGVLPEKPGTGFEAFLEKGLALAGNRKGGGSDSKVGAVFGKGWAKGLSKGQAIEKARTMYANLDDSVRKKYEDRANLKDVRSSRDIAANAKYKTDRAEALGLGKAAPPTPAGSVQRINGAQMPQSGPKPAVKGGTINGNPIDSTPKERLRHVPGQGMVKEGVKDDIDAQAFIDSTGAVDTAPQIAKMPNIPAINELAVDAQTGIINEPGQPTQEQLRKADYVANLAEIKQGRRAESLTQYENQQSPAASSAIPATPAPPSVQRQGPRPNQLGGNTLSALGFNPSLGEDAKNRLMGAYQGVVGGGKNLGKTAVEIGSSIKQVPQKAISGAVQGAAQAGLATGEALASKRDEITDAVARDVVNIGATPAPPTPKANKFRAAGPPQAQSVAANNPDNPSVL